jgi:glucokinase
MKEAAAGIDIGGIDTEIGLISEHGECYEKRTIITGEFPDVKQFITECIELISVLSKEGNYKVNAIGIAAPNGNPTKGTIENAVNLSWKGIIPFTEMMREFVHIPVVLTNDAKAAAVGEKLFGGAQNMKNFILITLGAGLGSGIYVHDHLLTGHLGLAGEMGHMIVKENGRMCNTKREGCLEAYASVTGIKRTVLTLLGESVQDSELRNFSFKNLDGEQITIAANNGDVIALQAFEFTGQILGTALANVISLFDPEAIFFAGGLAKAGDLLLKPTQKYIDKNVFPAFEGKVKLKVSALLDSNGGMIGAGALAWQKYKMEVPVSF